MIKIPPSLILEEKNPASWKKHILDFVSKLAERLNHYETQMVNTAADGTATATFNTSFAVKPNVQLTVEENDAAQTRSAKILTFTQDASGHYRAVNLKVLPAASVSVHVKAERP